jgi:signal transduction histidine kinase
LKIGSQLLGVLDIESEWRGAFTPPTVDALQIMADQLAIAIRNARLYAEVKQLNAELEDRVRARTAELEQAYTQLELLDRNKSAFIRSSHTNCAPPCHWSRASARFCSHEPALQADDGTRLQVEGIVNGAERMHEIVNSMLDVVRIDSETLELRPCWLSLQDLLAALKDNLTSATASRNLMLTLEPPCPVCQDFWGL